MELMVCLSEVSSLQFFLLLDLKQLHCWSIFDPHLKPSSTTSSNSQSSLRLGRIVAIFSNSMDEDNTDVEAFIAIPGHHRPVDNSSKVLSNSRVLRALVQQGSRPEEDTVAAKEGLRDRDLQPKLTLRVPPQHHQVYPRISYSLAMVEASVVVGEVVLVEVIRQQRQMKALRQALELLQHQRQHQHQHQPRLRPQLLQPHPPSDLGSYIYMNDEQCLRVKNSAFVFF